MSSYYVKDISLASQGLRNLELAESRMKGLLLVREQFATERPLQGLRIGIALHVTKETGVLVRTLRAGGAEVAVASCNPLSTQDDVAAALVSEGVSVFAVKGESEAQYYQFIDHVIGFRPDLTIDDGADLITRIHSNHPEMLEGIIAGCEETTTGVQRLRAMEADGALKYPVIAVNDNKTKHLLDNHYGTGQSSIDGLLRSSNVLIAGKSFVVAGYGDCGRGVAKYAAGLGAHVIVTETNPISALQAFLDGYRVMPMAQAARRGDIFLTVTGNRDVITDEHFQSMKEGALLANAGHFNVEIDVNALRKYPSRQVRPGLEAFDIPDRDDLKKTIYLAGEGRLVNLAVGEGHPSEVMSTSFLGQSLAVKYAVQNKGRLPNKVITLPEEVDDDIARIQLEAMGVRIDSLSARQKEYLSSWREGT